MRAGIEVASVRASTVGGRRVFFSRLAGSVLIALMSLLPLTAHGAPCERSTKADGTTACPCAPSDKPNVCDEAGWCVDREKITQEVIEIRGDGNEAELYVKIAIEYSVDPPCGNQVNLIPYTTDGVDLYITARTSSDNLGVYRSFLDYDLGFTDTDILSDGNPDTTPEREPIKLRFIPEESTFNKRFFETPNGTIIISQLQPAPPGKSPFIDIVLALANESNRATGRAAFPIEIGPAINPCATGGWKPDPIKIPSNVEPCQLSGPQIPDSNRLCIFNDGAIELLNGALINQSENLYSMGGRKVREYPKHAGVDQTLSPVSYPHRITPQQAGNRYIKGELIRGFPNIRPPLADPEPTTYFRQQLPSKGWVKSGEMVTIVPLVTWRHSEVYNEFLRWIFIKNGTDLVQPAGLVQGPNNSTTFRMPDYDLIIYAEYVPKFTVQVSNGFLYLGFGDLLPFWQWPIGEGGKPSVTRQDYYRLLNDTSYLPGHTWAEVGDCSFDGIVSPDSPLWGPTCARVNVCKQVEMIEDTPPHMGVYKWEVSGGGRKIELHHEEIYGFHPNGDPRWRDIIFDPWFWISYGSPVERIEMPPYNLTIQGATVPKVRKTLEGGIYLDNGRNENQGWRNGYRNNIWAGKSEAYFHPGQFRMYSLRPDPLPDYEHPDFERGRGVLLYDTLDDYAIYYGGAWNEEDPCASHVPLDPGHIYFPRWGIQPGDANSFVIPLGDGYSTSPVDEPKTYTAYRVNHYRWITAPSYCTPWNGGDVIRKPTSQATSFGNLESADEFATAQELTRVGPTLYFLGMEGPPPSVEAPSIAQIKGVSKMSDPCTPVTFSFLGDDPSIVQLENSLKVQLPSFPPDAGEPTLYFNPGRTSWTKESSQVYNSGIISACLSDFGHYQAFVAGIKSAPIDENQSFQFGEVYVFPNPVKQDYEPVLRVEVIQADKIGVRIYDVSGELGFQTTDLGLPTEADGRSTYEKVLPKDKFKSGVYLGVVSAEKSGRGRIQKKFRFSVLK